MPEAEGGGIFVSYRRQETSHLAGRLSDRLADRFGEGQVFMDVDAIEPGVDFAEEISRAVAACKVLLAVIGPNWLTATDQRGRRRLDDPDDLVRLEIEAALARNVRVIPILVEGAVMPDRQDLPESLARLARLNAPSMRHETFRSDAGRLVTAIERALAAAPAAAVPRAAGAHAAKPERKPARSQQEPTTADMNETMLQRREASRSASPYLRDTVARGPTLHRSGAGDSSIRPTGVDESEMILVPGGEFYTGLTKAQLKEINEAEKQLPSADTYSTRLLREHWPNSGSMLDVPAFRIAKFPVTNTEYARFVAATGRFPPQHWDGSEPPGRLRDHPVVWVSWAAANAYCEWLRAEIGLPFRLPSTVEWEKAARSVDGRKFPWGNDFDRSRCHFKARSTVPVTAHAPAGDSIFGVSDMVGNAREWTSTQVEAHSATIEVRGGGFQSGSERGLWCSNRDAITGGPKASIGFRVALSQ
jgi:formylglycine-generating enzyme required for sulfatase activity